MRKSTIIQLFQVPKVVQDRVKLWMEYSWQQQQNSDENKMLSFLPGKMRTDLALRVRNVFRVNTFVILSSLTGPLLHPVQSEAVSRL